MTIVFVIPAMQSVKAFFVPLFRELLKRGDKVSLCTNVFYESEKFNWEIELPDGLVVHDIEIPRSPIPLKTKSIHEKILKVIGNQPTVVHGHFFMGSLLVSSLPSKKGLTKFCSLHGLIEDDLGFAKGLIIKFLEKYIAKKSDCLWLFNTTDYQRLKKFKPVKLLPGYGMGIDNSRFENIDAYRKQKEDIRRSLGISVDGLVFVFSGRLIQTKGISNLIDGFNLANKAFLNIYLLLVGEADPAHKNIEIESRAEIIHVGWQTNLQKYFAVSDIYITASHREAISVGTMEAIYCGLPVLCPPTKGIAELIDHKKNGFVTRSNSSEEMCTGIKYFVENKNLIPEMSESLKADRNKYLRINSVNIQIKEYDELLHVKN